VRDQEETKFSGNSISRRSLLTGLGASAGLLIAHDGLPAWAVGSRYHRLSYQETLSLLDASLSLKQRALVVLPFDHPSRQITNTVAIEKGPHIGTMFNANQLALVRQLYNTMLSNQGQQWFRNTTRLEGKFEGSILRLYSDAQPGELATDNRTIAMLNGGHYMLRNAQSAHRAQTYVFGGPISYGQQIGNGRFKVQGNAFKAHGDAVNELHSALGLKDRARAYQSTPPMELLTQVQGPNGVFPGLRIGDTGPQVQALAKNMLATIFSAYPETQQRDAFSAIEENGGIESLHLALYRDFSFYQDGQRLIDLSTEQATLREAPYTQVWRIEGPACVIHFKGYPHVHAYINVVRDPSKVAIGEVLAKTRSAVSGDGIKYLLEAALRFETDEDLAYFPMAPAGRLATGLVSTGSIFSLDPFNNYSLVVEVEEPAMSEKLKASLVSQGAKLVAGGSIRFATMSYMLADSRELGEIAKVVSTGAPIRESLIALIRSDPEVLHG
jgi:hypothetical protein